MSLPDRITLMGMPVDRVAEPDAVAAILGELEAGNGGAVITAHLEILRRYATEPGLRPLFDAAELIVADGQPLVWASRIQGTPLPERVAGSDVVWSLAAECALRGRSVYMLGGAPGAGDEACRRLQAVYPGLHIAGCESPPIGFDSDPEAIAGIRRRLYTARPDVVFVALGFPKQERVIAELRPVLPGAWFLGVGISLSFVAGDVVRAPDWMARLGLEWLHRLTQEPRRLFRRYLLHGLPFAVRLFTSALASRVRARGRLRAPARIAPDAPRVVFHHGQVERQRMRELADELDHLARESG